MRIVWPVFSQLVHVVDGQITANFKKRLNWLIVSPENFTAAVSECLRNDTIKKILISFVYSCKSGANNLVFSEIYSVIISGLSV